MPDLLEPADPRGRDRALTEDVERGAQSAEREAQETENILRSALGAPRSPLLLFDHVSKWYGPVIGVNQVTLELHPGITGLVGANGAGKSTLMRLGTGQLRPDLGSVQVRGHDAWQAAAKRYLGYSPDSDNFYEEMSGRQFVETIARLHGFPRREARRRTA